MNKDIVRNYFNSWTNYDLNLLSNIFDINADYIIKNKSFSYNGIKQIIDYWIRNSKRQKDLKLDWKIVKENKKSIKVEFNASFYDIEEKEFNYINGIINFYISNNKIYRLSENYIKSVNT